MEFFIGKFQNKPIDERKKTNEFVWFSNAIFIGSSPWIGMIEGTQVFWKKRYKNEVKNKTSNSHATRSAN